MALQLSPDKVSLCSFKSKTDLRFCEVVQRNKKQGVYKDIQTLFSQAKIHGKQTMNVVLSPSDYQLHLMSAQNVPEAEMAEAIKWSVVSQFSYQEEKIFVDYFPSIYQDKIYTIICQRERILGLRALLFRLGVTISRLDIAEMALRNLLYQTPDAHPIRILLRLSPDGNYAYYYWQQAFVQRVRLPDQATQEQAKWERLVDKLALVSNKLFNEYYQVAEKTKAEDDKVFACLYVDTPFTNESQEQTSLLELLKKNLICDIKPLAISSYFADENSLSMELAHEAAPVIGGCLYG